MCDFVLRGMMRAFVCEVILGYNCLRIFVCMCDIFLCRLFYARLCLPIGHHYTLGNKYGFYLYLQFFFHGKGYFIESENQDTLHQNSI